MLSKATANFNKVPEPDQTVRENQNTGESRRGGGEKRRRPGGIKLYRILPGRYPRIECGAGRVNEVNAKGRGEEGRGDKRVLNEARGGSGILNAREKRHSRIIQQGPSRAL